MDPVEPEGPINRLERTLWSVWCYITEAFDRVFRPPLADENGSNSLQDSAGDSAAFEGGDAQAGTTGAPSPSLRDDSGEVCTEDAALKLKRSNESQESREEEFDPTGNDEAGLCLAKAHENKKHKTEIEKFSTGEGSKVSKMDEENEVADSGSPGEVVTGEDTEESDGEACSEEDDQSRDARDGHREMEEPETEDSFEAEDGEVKVCTFTDESPEEEHQILKEHGNEDDETRLEQDKNDELLQTKDQLTLSWKLLEDVRISEATENQTAAEEPNMENSNSVADNRQEEVLLDQFVTSSQEDVQTTEVAHKEEDVMVTYVQNTAETETIPSEISVSSKFVDGDCLEEERLTSEVNNKGISVSTVTPDMGKAESETEQEISGEFKNTPMWLIEGQGVVLQERNPQACKEAQEGVPEHNNEFQPDENTTQRFREGGNCQEIQITQLPEEVENKEEESLKNSHTGADCLLMKEVKQAGEENSLDLDVEQHRAFEEQIPQEANLESEHLYAKEEAKAEESSMKTEINPFHEEFETYTGSADEADELQDGADFGKDGVSSDSKETPGREWESLGGVAADERKGFTNETLKFPETGEEKKDMRFFQDFASNAESSPEEMSTWKLHEPTYLDHSNVEKENVSIETHEEKEEAQVRCDNVCLEVEATAGEMKAIVELSAPSEIQESENQSQDKALEMNERTKADTDDKLKTSEPKELPELLSETMEDMTQSENICEPIKGHQDVIDEDILDLWIETAMSEDFHDTDVTKPGDLLEEEPGEMYPKETEQLVKSNSGELVRDSGVESGILQWSLSSGSLQDNRDICAASPDFPVENFETPEGADHHLEAEDLTEMRSDTDSGVSSPHHINVCGDKDFGSPEIETELSQVGDEPIEMCFSDTPDEIKLSESEQQPGWIEDITEPLHPDMLEENHSEVDSPVLDFASQKSRIAVKNPRVRPPKNPRTLLQKPSADPIPPVPMPVKAIPGLPLGGMGVGFKLPGLGEGFPVLKRRQQADVGDEDEPKPQPQEPEKPEEEKRDASQPDEAPHRPKWKPPGQLGFGNPLMSELKTKLKKTT